MAKRKRKLGEAAVKAFGELVEGQRGWNGSVARYIDDHQRQIDGLRAEIKRLPEIVSFRVWREVLKAGTILESIAEVIELITSGHKTEGLRLLKNVEAAIQEQMTDLANKVPVPNDGLAITP